MSAQPSQSDLHIRQLARMSMWALNAVRADSDRSPESSAVHACLLLALRQLDLDNVKRSAQSPEARELNQLEMYLANNHPDVYESCESIATGVIDLFSSFYDRVTAEEARAAALAADIERLQTDFEQEADEFRKQIERDRVDYEHKCAELVTLIAEQDVTIQGQRAEIARLTTQLQDVSLERAELDRQVELAKFSYGELTAQLADAQARVIDLTAQLEAAKVRPVMRTILAAPIPPITDDDDDAPGPAGDLDVALAQANGRGVAVAVTDWAGLPSEYHHLVDLLTAGKRKWSDLALPARRSIALCVISKMATDGALTMAEFDSDRPGYMPTASNMANLFGQRWSTVVKNAVSVGQVAP